MDKALAAQVCGPEFGSQHPRKARHCGVPIITELRGRGGKIPGPHCSVILTHQGAPDSVKGPVSSEQIGQVEKDTYC